MSDRKQNGASALVFGARNLGRAVIETLIGHGWAVAGVARSDATLEGVTEAGALALRADVTDQASVRSAVEQAAEAHGGVDLVLNAASAYGGTRSGPFGGDRSRRPMPTRSTRGRLRPRARPSASSRGREASSSSRRARQRSYR